MKRSRRSRDRRRPGRPRDEPPAQAARASRTWCSSAHRIAERWRSERWDGLQFQFPNWSVRLPDFPFPHSDPDAFATTATSSNSSRPMPISSAPDPLRRRGDAARRSVTAPGFIAETTDGTIAADNVVVATGPYQRTLVPDLLRDHPVFQVHASRLPESRTASAGRGAGGRRQRVRRADRRGSCCSAGRRVYLSVGRHRRLPRRYRGRDLIWWLAEMRLDQITPEERGPARLVPSFPAPMAAAPSISAASPPTA